MAGAGFLVYALWSGRSTILDEIGQLSLPILLVALALLVLAVVCAAISWAVLLGVDFKTSGLAYLRALPAKHVPGGLGMPMSQVSFEAGRGGDSHMTMIRLVQHFVISLGAGGVVALVALSGAMSGGPLAWASALGFALIGLLSLPAALSAVTIRIPRVRGSAAANRQVAIAMGVTGVGVVAMCGAFAAVLSQYVEGAPVLLSMAAFALAWAVGLAVVPVPAGLGLRESALFVFAVGIDPALLVLAAVIIRLLALAADAAVAIMVRMFESQSVKRRPEGVL